MCFSEQKTVIKNKHMEPMLQTDRCLSFGGQLGCRWACAVFSLVISELNLVVKEKGSLPVSCCASLFMMSRCFSTLSVFSIS